MPLNELSLSQLKELADDLASLAKVGQGLAPLNPVFDLTPGQPTRITLDGVMPEVSALSDRDQFLSIQAAILASNGKPAASPDPAVQAERLASLVGRTSQLPSVVIAPPEPALDPVDAPLVPGEVTEGAPLSAEGQSRPDNDPAPDFEVGAAGAEVSPPALTEATSDGAEAESGGGQAMAAAEPPAAPTPGSASALAASTLAVKPWTEVEDAQLIGMIVGDVVGHGHTMAAAIRTAAKWLDRPEQGTAFRCRNKLKARLDTALAAAMAAKVEAEELLAPKWTEDEDTILVDTLVTAALDGGTSPQAALRMAALKLPRWTERQVQTHLDTVLKDCVAAEIAARRAPKIPDGPAPANATDGSTASEGDTAVGGHTPAAVQDSPDAVDLDAQSRETAIEHGNGPEDAPPPDLQGLDLRLWQYLRRNRPRWPMTIGTDLDLVEALGRGDKLSMIAADIGIDAVKLKDRFQTLTAMILDAKDRPTIDGQQRLVKLLRRIVADAAPTKAA
jgi:hypothetical protein